jgi:hypothetical protein
MKKLLALTLMGLMSGFLSLACQRDEGVRAGNDAGSDTYQPRPAPNNDPDNAEQEEISGELIKVDVPKKTISVRVENGMEQTFKFNDQTMVFGLTASTVETPARAEAPSSRRVRDLVGKEGSEVSVQWSGDGSAAKMATRVTVTQISTSKSTRKAAKKRG